MFLVSRREGEDVTFGDQMGWGFFRSSSLGVSVYHSTRASKSAMVCSSVEQ
jgi:hypothetical protein